VHPDWRAAYLEEFGGAETAARRFLNGVGNLSALKGQPDNLYKCFLPHSSGEWASESGGAGFLHPEGVYEPEGVSCGRCFIDGCVDTSIRR